MKALCALAHGILVACTALVNAEAAISVSKGLLTWVPGVRALFRAAEAGGATASAHYCYGVWLKHLVLLWQHGMREMPVRVLELGPGRSLGTGLAALLSGALRYCAIDAIRLAHSATNAAVFDELTRLFRSRTPRPQKGWPDFDSQLDRRLYPGHILTEDRLRASLAPERLARVAAALRPEAARAEEPIIRYRTWSEPDVLPGGKMDLVFSHAVLGQVEDLEGAYADSARWLKPGGWMSHHIDLSSLGATRAWNGHLGYSDLAWRLARGRRAFFAQRERLSRHLELMHRAGFTIVKAFRGRRSDGLRRHELAPRWARISDDDLYTWSVFIIARRG